MSNQIQDEVALIIDGVELTAPKELSVIQALWHAGIPRVKGVGCLDGVCGSCRVMLRRKGNSEVEMALGCRTLVEEGMEVMFLDFPNPPHQIYNLGQIKNSWDIQSHYKRIFPEAKSCRQCHGCVKACPKGIDVELGVKLANSGNYREAGELFIECVMCNLCMTGCPENISPNHVGLFSRRVTAYFHTRPANLIHRIEQIRTGEFKVDISNYVSEE